MDIVLVTWVDAVLEDEHVGFDCAKHLAPLKRYNIGYLLVDNDDFITLLFGTIENCYKGNTAADKVLTIPRGMIVKIEQLEIKKSV